MMKNILYTQKAQVIHLIYTSDQLLEHMKQNFQA